MKLGEQVKPKGRVELFITKGRPKIIPGTSDIDFSGVKILETRDIQNIILNAGKDRIIESLTSGFIKTIARMAIGDRGTIPSDPTVPKVPTSDLTALYNEVYRADIDTTVLNVGLPTTHEVKFTKVFSSLDVPITSFSNQANPVVNEVALVLADLIGGNSLPRPPVAAPASPDADEELFSIRTFKSVPFEAANEIAITVRYTIFIE